MSYRRMYYLVLFWSQMYPCIPVRVDGIVSPLSPANALDLLSHNRKKRLLTGYNQKKAIPPYLGNIRPIK